MTRAERDDPASHERAPYPPPPRDSSPTSPGRLLLHFTLLVATIFTTTAMGTLLSVDVAIPEDASFTAATAALLLAIVRTPAYLLSGLVFSFTLLTILGAHELGHYLACRYYGVDASLPYFLPAPPPVFVGTFGAFIRIRSPFTTRRALFDIGVAGPLAGFCFALPAAFVGLAFAAPAATGEPGAGAVLFHDPLLFRLVAWALRLPANIEWNPIYFAAWIGLFATGINLIPVGQLDGGHAAYALFGPRGHRATSIAFFAVMVTIAAASAWFYSSFVWFLYVGLLALFAFRPHPPPETLEAEIGRGRMAVAAVVLLVFVLSFLPFPITFG